MLSLVTFMCLALLTLQATAKLIICNHPAHPDDEKDALIIDDAQTTTKGYIEYALKYIKTDDDTPKSGYPSPYYNSQGLVWPGDGLTPVPEHRPGDMQHFPLYRLGHGDAETKKGFQKDQIGDDQNGAGAFRINFLPDGTFAGYSVHTEYVKGRAKGDFKLCKPYAGDKRPLQRPRPARTRRRREL